VYTYGDGIKAKVCLAPLQLYSWSSVPNSYQFSDC